MTVKKRTAPMAQLAVLVWLWISLGLPVVTCQNVAKLVCPRYVLEHQDLSCVCQPPAGRTGTATWPGHSENNTLTVPQVRRTQNGTQYQCEVKGQEAGQTWSATYTLLVAYGPSQQEFRISGQRPFPTNGNQTLTLTCEVGEVYPAPDFTWRDVDCDGSETDPTCDVTPRPPDDDQKVVLCEVSRNYKTRLPRNLMTTEYEVQLTYPPLTSPHITVQAAQPPLLVRGDNLTCTISGGKPGVDKVVFSCSDPDHGDQLDERVAAGGLSSTVTVTSVSQSQRPMFCECRGVWNVKPEYYSATAEGFYHVEHPAVVTDLNINGCSDCVVTLTGGANHTALFLCSTFGRPAPSEGHFSKEADPSFDASSHRHHKNTADWSTNFTLEIDQVACQDMGRYTCTAGNGAGDRGQASVQLNVECAPWKAPEEMMNMTEAGTWFQLNAFPVPDRFTYYYLGNRSLQDNGTPVDPESFVTVCEQDDVILYQVSCHTVPTRVPTDMLGDYRVSVGNSLGEVDLFFFILMTVSPEESSGVSGGVIAGSVVGVLLAVGVALLAFWLYRRYWKKTAPTKTVDTIEGSPDQNAAPLHTVMTPMGPLKKPKWEERPVDVPDISNNNDNGQIRTVCTPRHRGPTSTPIKGSTMTESDLGYSARLQALLPKQSMEDSGYGEVADSVKPPPPETVVDADHAYASAEEVIVVEAMVTGVIHAGHLAEESAACDSGSDHDPDDLHPPPHPGVPQGGGEYAILEEVGPQSSPDRGAQKEVLAAVSSAGVPRADSDYAILEEVSPQRTAEGGVPQETPYAVSPSLDTQAGSGDGQQQSDYHPIYSQVRVTMTGQGNSILTTSPGSDKSTGTGKKKKSVRMALEPEIVTSESEYDVLCRQGQSVPVSTEDDTYNHIGNFAFTPN